MWIFSCGPVRSGSTLHFNIIREILERSGKGYAVEYVYPELFEQVLEKYKNDNRMKVFKTHSITPVMEKMIRNGEAKGICCYRDVRDVIVSAQHKESGTISHNANFGSFTNKYIKYISFVEQMPNIMLSRYESFYCNIESECNKVSDFLNIEIDDLTKKDISNSLNYNQGKKIAENNNKEDFTGKNTHIYKIDKKTLIHNNHFKHIHPGAYKMILSKRNLLSIEQVAYFWLIRHKYNINLLHLLKIALNKIRSKLR